MRSLFCRVLALLMLTAMALPAIAQKQHPSLPTLRVPQSAGVNIHFTDARPGEMQMLSGAFRIVRMDFFWAGIEKEKGVYDFSAYDRLMESLDAHKVRALFILDYSNPHYDQGLSPYTDEGRAAFARWAAAAARHFKGRGILWELFNEPNISFWKPKPNVDDYIKLDKAVSAAIRKAAPGECYFGAATSTIDLKFLESCFQSGALARWDAVSVHPYRQNDPETASSEYRQLRALIQRYKPKGKTIPILSGEWGYSTAWNGFNDERQGKYLPRQWLTNLMNEVPLSIWYDWHDDGEDAHEAEHNFGSVEFPYFEKREPVYNPKPSYQAAQAFVKFFEGYAFNKRLALPSPDDYMLLFSKGKDVKLAVWTTRAAHGITLPASPGAFRITNHLGEVKPQLRSEKAGLTLSISDEPLYLQPLTSNTVLQGVAQWKRLPLEVFVIAPKVIANTLYPDSTFITRRMMHITRDAMPEPISVSKVFDGVTVTQTSTVVVTNPLRLALTPMGKQLQVRLENPSGEPLSGRVISKSNPPQNITLKAGETEKTLTLTGPTVRNISGVGETTVRFEGARKDDFIEAKRRFQHIWHIQEPTWQTLARDYKAVPDGDAKVASEQTLSVDQSIEGSSPSGGPLLKLTYRFEPGWKFANIQPLTDALKKVTGQPIAIGIWIYGDNSNNVIRLRYRDATGQTFQPNGTSINWKGWRYYEFPLDGSGGFWGGANDGQIHYPIQLDSLFILDSIRTENNKGEIYISDPMWVF